MLLRAREFINYIYTKVPVSNCLYFYFYSYFICHLHLPSSGRVMKFSKNCIQLPPSKYIKPPARLQSFITYCFISMMFMVKVRKYQRELCMFLLQSESILYCISYFMKLCFFASESKGNKTYM